MRWLAAEKVWHTVRNQSPAEGRCDATSFPMSPSTRAESSLTTFSGESEPRPMPASRVSSSLTRKSARWVSLLAAPGSAAYSEAYLAVLEGLH